MTLIRAPGKGSRRRPEAVPAETVAENWARTFSPRPEPLPPLFTDGLCERSNAFREALKQERLINSP